MVFASGFGGLRAQQALDTEALINIGWDWVEEHIDTELIEEVAGASEDIVLGFWQQVQPTLQEASVTEVASMRAQAEDVLKVLEASENLAPYASWLRTRMDYFEVAEDIRRLSPKPPAPKPRPPSARSPSPQAPPKRKPLPRRDPPPQVQRKVWEQKAANTPVPRGAAALVPRLKPIFAKHGMPEQLVWLAETESSFNPSARSPVGAAGLYQFMPATAKHLGLSLKPTDERLVPEKSAQAAAQYLSYLHRRFGDWPLALAAYNAGEGRVSKLLRAQKTKSFYAIAPHLPAETQLYVPKFEGVLLKRESVRLEDLPAPRKTAGSR